MTRYPAGPYTLEIPYIVSNISHTVEVNCDVIGTPSAGDNPIDVTMRTKDGDGATLSTCANALWDVLRPLWTSAVIASTYTLWRRNANNNDKEFVSGGLLVSPNGSGVGTLVLASQVTATWRSAKGGIVKLVLQEVIPGATNTRNPITPGDIWVYPISQFILGTGNFVTARDRSFPVSAMNASYGQNEKLFNRRFRA